jgi:Zn-dependent peptidase ImmA (M78 family)
MRNPEQMAGQLREAAGQQSLPVDVAEIARQRGASVVYETMGPDLSGLLYRDGGTVVIGVNSLHATNRQRFTIAHELGHLVLHQGRPVVLDHVVRLNFRDPRSGMATDAEEIQANRFAAELLMPAERVRAEARRGRDAATQIDEGFIKDLADGFEVSVEAMKNRLTNLGLLSQV